MDSRKLKIIGLVIWSGVGILIVGIGLSFPTFYPYFDSVLRTSELATAPPITAVNSEAVVGLLPFEEAGGFVTATATAGPPPSPTPTSLPTIPPTVAALPVLPSPTPLPEEQGALPTRVRIPTIDLDAPVVPIGWELVEGQAVWQVPDWRAVGWHDTSASLGVLGNTVLNGHNTTRGEVFRDLYKVEPGELLYVEGEDGETYTYRVESTYILQEAGQPLEVRMQNARYIQPTLDERLTLVTCHPYGSTRYRLIIIAFPEIEPVDLAQIGGE